MYLFKSILKITFFFLILIQNKAFAFESWQSLETRMILDNKQFSYIPNILKFSTETRYGNKSDGLGNINTRIGSYWQINPILSVGTSISAHSEQLTSNIYGQQLRLELEPSLSTIWNNISLTNRSRIEYRFKSNEKNIRFRNQGKISFPFINSNFNYFISDETFFEFSNKDIFNQNRLSTGISYKINEITKIDIGYLLLTKLEKNNWSNNHILLLNFIFIPYLSN